MKVVPKKSNLFLSVKKSLMRLRVTVMLPDQAIAPAE